MAMTRTDVDYNVELRDMEIVKMKIELLRFIRKMQSEGFLESIDCEEMTLEFETDRII